MPPLLQRLIVPLSVVTAAALLVAWFPLSTMLGQSGQLNATAHQLAVLQSESQELSAEQAGMHSTQAAIALAREEYQLVLPGQRLIQVLNTGSTANYTGDPGDQPLANPTVGGTGSLSDPTNPLASASHASTLWSRVLTTLEFWR
jgi:hypothetical protein